jgi:hypothetical protein
MLLFLILKSSKVHKIAGSAAPAFNCQLWVFRLWHWSVDSINLLSWSILCEYTL